MQSHYPALAIRFGGDDRGGCGIDRHLDCALIVHWQIWGDAQVVRNKVIPRICQGTVQYSRSYRFRQIYRLLSPNFLCTAVTNSTGQRIVKYRETDAISEKMSTLAEGSEPLSDYR